MHVFLLTYQEFRGIPLWIDRETIPLRATKLHVEVKTKKEE